MPGQQRGKGIAFRTYFKNTMKVMTMMMGDDKVAVANILSGSRNNGRK